MKGIFQTRVLSTIPDQKVKMDVRNLVLSSNFWGRGPFILSNIPRISSRLPLLLNCYLLSNKLYNFCLFSERRGCRSLLTGYVEEAAEAQSRSVRDLKEAGAEVLAFWQLFANELLNPETGFEKLDTAGF